MEIIIVKIHCGMMKDLFHAAAEPLEDQLYHNLNQDLVLRGSELLQLLQRDYTFKRQRVLMLFPWSSSVSKWSSFSAPVILQSAQQFTFRVLSRANLHRHSSDFSSNLQCSSVRFVRFTCFTVSNGFKLSNLHHASCN
ncbi:Hypothetical_protein [Hexamita inflata]|uniref:Hypothetical_protein n=1 Tax=Hexamita inflata TaxID=28002 RepID=A0AA86TRC4_9EUKA|nr:Hypothetical protein HINF_LOCUS11474 [Hexamita inflata]CAI9923832.1 Hypothetical protein HINF_LOCUS11477 [Hexamita inflata]